MPKRAATSATPKEKCASVRYIARQPIFNSHESVFGYELLFRSGLESYFHATNADAATCTTIDTSLLIGADSLTEGKRAFINCTREVLVRETVTLLPRDSTVLEILEDVEPDPELVMACRRLKRMGYSFALDDFVDQERWGELLELTDYIKVDFKASTPEQWARSAHRFNRRGLFLLAEKVETREEFERAREIGYRYFQGYFFCRPTTFSAADIPAVQLSYLNLLAAVQQPTIDIRELERIIKHEASLCYRLLRYLNSAAFGLYPVRSISHALILLGENEIRKWISLVVTVMMTHKKPPELVLLALTRAQFCESASAALKLPSNDLFLLGMLSLMDAMLDQPMDRVLAHLPVTDDCKAALLGKPGALSEVLPLASACECGDWEALTERSRALGLNQDWVAKSYAAARNWAARMRRSH